MCGYDSDLVTLSTHAVESWTCPYSLTLSISLSLSVFLFFLLTAGMSKAPDPCAILRLASMFVLAIPRVLGSQKGRE